MASDVADLVQIVPETLMASKIGVEGYGKSEPAPPVDSPPFSQLTLVIYRPTLRLRQILL